ncbi:MAG: Eco57I restriction-modification methylase domain-containing protein [Promethearchaeota archaeon]
MNSGKFNDFKSKISNYIRDFEENLINKKEYRQSGGIVYTPKEIANFITENCFRIYFKNIQNKIQTLNSKEKIKRILSTKILDPACGSGRFLVSAAEYLFKKIKNLELDLDNIEIKKIIIENCIYGVDIDYNAILISKIRLFKWLFKDIDNYNNLIDSNIHFDIKLNDLSNFLEYIPLKFNILCKDFLLEYINEFKNLKFDLIIGNPPYIENKKIKGADYKKELYNKFKSAYKLFDISILFLEKGLYILNDESGVISFIMPNKFLAADYGEKIRDLILSKAYIEKLINISSLPIFKNTSIYPIIIFLKKKTNKKQNNHKIDIFLINSLKELKNFDNHTGKISVEQSLFENLPKKIFPISKNIELIQFLYANYKTLQDQYKDLKIIYRPYGFLNWSKFLDNVSEFKQHKRDLILLGTGNIGKYYFNLEKKIRIANRTLNVSYFNYNSEIKKRWYELEKEKLIFREIARELTFVFDPGLFTNVTGLYFLIIPSFKSRSYFQLLALFNSKLLDVIFKTLFGTLHMSQGYLRFNAIFIKQLPIPDNIPSILSDFAFITQFISQLINSIYISESMRIKLEKILRFFLNLIDAIIFFIYFKPILSDEDYYNLQEILNKKSLLKNVNFSELISYLIINLKQKNLSNSIKNLFNKIEEIYNYYEGNERLATEINRIISLKIVKLI